MEKIDALAALGALAHANRLDIFRLLVQAGPEGMRAGLIAERLGIAGPTLSFHLNHLKNARLVACARQGRWLIYVAEFAQVNALLGYLTENCCAGVECGLQQTVCGCDATPDRDSNLLSP